MILTGEEIGAQRRAGVITIEPFSEACLEPNSYGFHLGTRLLVQQSPELDPRTIHDVRQIQLNATGYLLRPGRHYLGETLECLGSRGHAATLYASRSVSTLGMWIQFSAPLGHTGAIIPWTLEIAVAHPIRIYPGMLIGKIAFWLPQGSVSAYDGRYATSSLVTASQISEDYLEAIRTDGISP